MQRLSGIWYSLTVAKLRNFCCDNVVILHVQKLIAVMIYAYWKQLGASCLSWSQSDEKCILKVCEFYFILFFLSYVLTIYRQNWNPSLNSSRHCRWSGTTCSQLAVKTPTKKINACVKDGGGHFEFSHVQTVYYVVWITIFSWPHFSNGRAVVCCYGCHLSACPSSVSLSVCHGCTVAKRCKIGFKLFLITNRNSHTVF